MKWRILGPVEAIGNGGPIPVGRPQHRAVLAFMLLNANRPVSVEQLIEALWGGMAPSTARTQVHGCVSRLRQALRTGGLGEAIVRSPAGYRLDVGEGEFDLAVFTELTSRAREAPPAEAVPVLREALGLWRGEALAGAAGAFVAGAATGLTEKRLTALEHMFESELALGRHGPVMAQLHTVVAEFPLRERLVGLLMTALAESGQQAEALRVFEQTRDQLAEELGIEPSSELAALHLQVLRQELPHRQQHQQQPPAAPVPVTPAQLPPDLSTFTGRDADLAALDAMLPNGDNAYAPTAPTIVAIVGTPGVGKTALAVRWAHRVRHLYPDGQLFLDLAGHAAGPPVTPLEALSRVLRAVGVPPSSVPDGEKEAACLYRSMLSGRRMLVVLDNVRDSGHARELLPGSAGCLVVTTSRSRLDGLVARDDARRLPLDLLSSGEATTLLARIVTGRRATAEPVAMTDLADACARLPLALRIAAADLCSRPHETIAGYAARLRKGDGLSTLAARDDEQMAVRSAFALSYQALQGPVRRMFRCFGLVPSTEITAESGAAMLGVSRDEAAGLLARLADAHLVVEREPGRFGCHDLLRLYATELARGPEGEAALRRLLGWYLSTADGAARRLYPQLLRLPLPESPRLPAPLEFADHTEALAWLDAERTNLTESIRHTSEHGPRMFAWALADQVRGYYWLGLRTVEWSIAAHAALTAARADRQDQAEAAGHLSLGALQWRLGRLEEAIMEYRQALDCARRAQWADGQASALGNLGPVYRMSGRLAHARATIEQALELNRQTGWAGGETVNLGNLALVFSDMSCWTRRSSGFRRRWCRPARSSRPAATR